MTTKQEKESWNYKCKNIFSNKTRLLLATDFVIFMLNKNSLELYDIHRLEKLCFLLISINVPFDANTENEDEYKAYIKFIEPYKESRSYKAIVEWEKIWVCPTVRTMPNSSSYLIKIGMARSISARLLIDYPDDFEIYKIKTLLHTIEFGKPIFFR